MFAHTTIISCYFERGRRGALSAHCLAHASGGGVPVRCGPVTRRDSRSRWTVHNVQRAGLGSLQGIVPRCTGLPLKLNCRENAKNKKAQASTHTPPSEVICNTSIRAPLIVHIGVVVLAFALLQFFYSANAQCSSAEFFFT